MMRVRFPLPAPDVSFKGFDGLVIVASLHAGCNFLLGVVVFLVLKKEVWAHIAQSVEHFLGKEEVTGSNPVMSSTLLLPCKLAS